MSALSIACGTTIFLVGCGDVFDKVFIESHVVRAGQFRKFIIGESKRAALQAVNETDANTVLVPVPGQEFLISKRNLEDISYVESAEGVRLFNYSGTAIHIYFTDEHISKIWTSYNKRDQTEFHVGDTKVATIAALSAALKEDDSLAVMPIVDHEGTGAYKVGDVMADTNSKLFAYNAWQFEVPSEKPSGAFYTLYFSNADLLTKIQYRRPRVRIDL